jgi:hypothetical protein
VQEVMMSAQKLRMLSERDGRIFKPNVEIFSWIVKRQDIGA